jgi:hypothetical protein
MGRREAAPSQIGPFLERGPDDGPDGRRDRARISRIAHDAQRPGRIVADDSAANRQVARYHRDTGSEALEQLVWTAEDRVQIHWNDRDHVHVRTRDPVE